MPVCFFVEIALEKEIEINERNCSGEEKQILLDEQHIEGVLNSILEVYLELPFEAIDQLCHYHPLCSLLKLIFLLVTFNLLINN